jgi:hypothetical protein
VFLSAWHEEAFRLPRTLGHYIQSNVCPADVVVRRPVPYSTVLRIVMVTILFSVCAFFVALLLFSFQKMRKAICISVGIAAGVVTVLICWCIINSWDSGDEDSENDELIDDESQ